MGWFVFGACLVVLALAFYGGVRFGARLPSASPSDVAMPVQRDVDSANDPGWRKTAIYLFRGEHGGRSNVLLYVGIAFDPQKRAGEHAGWGDAPMKTWWPDVKSVESHWCWARYIALGIEWALIRFLRPVHNKAPSGPDDSQCMKDRPDFRQAHVTLPRPNWANTQRKEVRR